MKLLAFLACLLFVGVGAFLVFVPVILIELKDMPEWFLLFLTNVGIGSCIVGCVIAILIYKNRGTTQFILFVLVAILVLLFIYVNTSTALSYPVLPTPFPAQTPPPTYTPVSPQQVLPTV